MTPPSSRPFPRFVADSSQQGLPGGEWAERLTSEFAAACAPYREEAGQPLDVETIRWFPERGWGGRIYIPVSARGVVEGDVVPVEYFGYISFVRLDDEANDFTDIVAKADFTDVTADDNPEWDIDINDEVIGAWRGDPTEDRGGDITLVWGTPLLPGGVAVTAELDGEVVDQSSVFEGRFTLIAVDAVRGLVGDPYLEILVWDNTLRRTVARESLYDASEEEEEEE